MMLGSSMMPVLVPRSSSIYHHQAPLPVGMYPPGLMFQPGQIYPGLGQQAPALFPHSWKPAFSYAPTSPPGLLHHQQKLASLLGAPEAVQQPSPLVPPSPPSLSPKSLFSGSENSLSPPCSPDSATGNASEKTTFTIDSILSSTKKRRTSSSTSSSHVHSPRAGFFGDRRMTPSPDSLTRRSSKSTSPVAWGNSHYNDQAVVSPVDEVCAAEGIQAKTTSHDGKRAQASSDVGENRLPGKDLKRDRCDDDGDWHHRAKRVRTIFTQEQLERLELEFDRQQYMVGTERLYLAAELSLSESQVKVWFQNRRIKWRKQNLEKQQVHLAHIRASRDTHLANDQGSEAEDELADDTVATTANSAQRGFLEDLARVRNGHVPEKSDAAVIARAAGAETAPPHDVNYSTPKTSDDSSALSTSDSFSAALQLEVKKVEQRLAMRLCRRNMMQATSTTSPSVLPSTNTLPSATHLRLMSNIHLMDNVRDVDYLSAAKRD